MRVVKLLNQLGQLMVVEAIAFAGSRGIAAVGGNPLLTVPIGVGTAVIALLAYARTVRLTERRSATEVPVHAAGPALGRDVIIGLLLFSAGSAGAG